MSLVGLLEDIRSVLVSLEIHIKKLEKENRQLKIRIKRFYSETIKDE